MVAFEREYDVVVCGAGVAGIAAALQAARRGCKTALVEKTILPGGLATSGIIFLYLPLCDGNGTQVTFGIAEELLHLSTRYGPGKVPGGWRQARNAASEEERYAVGFSPASFVLALDEALGEAGVHVWLDSLVAGVVMHGQRVAGVEVETKGGRGRLFARCAVDATGDANVAWRAGAPCVEGGNILSIWAIQASLEAARNALETGTAEPLLDLVSLGEEWSGLIPSLASHQRAGTDAGSVTQFVLDGRRLLREHFAEKQRATGDDGRCKYYPLLLPSMAQFRMTRRIVGRTTMAERQHGRRVADSVGLYADWRTAGHVWEVPYGALLPERIEGLLVAGRCIAADGDAWDVMRVIPAAGLTGQAAGMAAALAVGRQALPGDIEPSAIQQALGRMGVPCHLSEVYPA
jgi:2-polyprenyl-6-methoxyphenol hydroxylase-like FAD-dependent oxidoreductase